MDEASGTGSSRRGVAARTRTLAAYFAVAALVTAPVCVASIPSGVEIAVCPHIAQTTFPQAGPVGPSNFGCGPPVASTGDIFVNPDHTCTTPTNTDLGSFLTTAEPLGAWVNARGLNSCATNPPTLGPGVGPGPTYTFSVSQMGSCPTTRTIPVPKGPYGTVLLSIGSLPVGSYSVTVDFPDQTVFDPGAQQALNWIGSHASGTLHVGGTFTETDTNALARPGTTATFAVLLDNSVAGPGAGQLVSTKTGNPSIANLTGTDYYACGTINVAATVTYGKPGANGLARLSGRGSLTGGTGNYNGIKGTFTVKGSYSTKTNRGTFSLKGVATY